MPTVILWEALATPSALTASSVWPATPRSVLLCCVVITLCDFVVLSTPLCETFSDKRGFAGLTSSGQAGLALRKYVSVS